MSTHTTMLQDEKELYKIISDSYEVIDTEQERLGKVLDKLKNAKGATKRQAIAAIYDSYTMMMMSSTHIFKLFDDKNKILKKHIDIDFGITQPQP